jgi:hypothetical protein
VLPIWQVVEPLLVVTPVSDSHVTELAKEAANLLKSGF